MSIYRPQKRRQKGFCMENDSVEKVVIITGATSGIGRAVALRFAKALARVVAIGRNRSALEDVANEIKNAGGECLTLAADLTNESDSRLVIDTAVNEFGRLDVLVNAAGHISTGSIEDTTLSAWD